MVMPSMEVVLLGSELSGLVMDILHHAGFVMMVVGAYLIVRDFIRSLRR